MTIFKLYLTGQVLSYACTNTWTMGTFFFYVVLINSKAHAHEIQIGIQIAPSREWAHRGLQTSLSAALQTTDEPMSKQHPSVHTGGLVETGFLSLLVDKGFGENTLTWFPREWKEFTPMVSWRKAVGELLFSHITSELKIALKIVNDDDNQ